MSQLFFTKPGEDVGGYRVGNVTFLLTKRPCWLHRMGVRLVLGWTWIDL